MNSLYIFIILSFITSVISEISTPNLLRINPGAEINLLETPSASPTGSPAVSAFKWFASELTVDSPQTWASVTTSSSGKYVVAASTNGDVYMSSKYGASNSWSSIAPLSDSWVSVATSSSGSAVYLVSSTLIGGTGTFYNSQNYGSSFSQVDVVGYAFASVACSVQGTTVAAIAGSFAYISVNSGVASSFFASSPNTGSNLIAVAIGGEYIAVSNLAGVVSIGTISTSGQFVFWRTSKLPTAIYVAISMDAIGQHYVVAQENGNVYVSRNYGIGSFNVSNISPNETQWRSACTSTNGEVMAVGVGNSYNNNVTGTVYISRDYGSTFFASSAPNNRWFSLACPSGSLIVATASDTKQLYVANGPSIAPASSQSSDQIILNKAEVFGIVIVVAALALGAIFAVIVLKVPPPTPQPPAKKEDGLSNNPMLSSERTLSQNM
jgi:hypothetical protein